jgi:hypothetical protein
VDFLRGFREKKEVQRIAPRTMLIGTINRIMEYLRQIQESTDFGEDKLKIEYNQNRVITHNLLELSAIALATSLEFDFMAQYAEIYRGSHLELSKEEAYNTLFKDDTTWNVDEETAQQLYALLGAAADKVHSENIKDVSSALKAVLNGAFDRDRVH